MRLSIQIFTKSDAFKPSHKPELSRILLELAAGIENGAEMKPGFIIPIRDVAGKLVGTMSMLAQ